MGMVWTARLASDEQLAAIMEEPDTAYDFVVAEEDYDAAEPFIIDLDKEWHAAHFLLTGEAEETGEPLGLILGRFEPVGDDNGYGPAHVIPAASLRAFHNAMEALSNEDIRARFDVNAMQSANIYLADALASEGDEAVIFLLERVTQLRDFAKKGAAANLHAISVIT